MSTSSRARTLAHMQQMLATAVASQACSREVDTQTVTITPLPTVTSSPTDTNVAVPPLPTASATFNNAPPPPPPPPPPTNTAGYMVVDMLPAPARCMGLATSAVSSAAFAQRNGLLVLEVHVKLPPSGGFRFSGPPNAMTGGMVVSHTYSNAATSAVVTLRIPASARTSGVSFSVSCSAGMGSLLVNAAFNGQATSSVVSTTMTDF
jgi:hypothetical protein